jgi:hypothetical protein
MKGRATVRHFGNHPIDRLLSGTQVDITQLFAAAAAIAKRFLDERDLTIASGFCGD